jgi:hypothetical protein
VSKLWTPPTVSRELRESTAEHNVATLGMFDFNYGVFDKWNKELKKIDPLLRLGKAKDGAFALGVIPGYYHILRIPESNRDPLWVVPLHDGNLGFVEPTSAMLDMLRASDMQNPRVMREHKRVQEELAAKEEKQRQEDSDRRKDMAYELWKANTQVRIPFHNDARWSQTVKGQRGRLK